MAGSLQSGNTAKLKTQHWAIDSFKTPQQPCFPPYYHECYFFKLGRIFSLAGLDDRVEAF